MCTLVENNGTDTMIYVSQNSTSLLAYAMFYRMLFLSIGADISIGISYGLFLYKVNDHDS
jgi:hypothetical protein